VARPRPADEAKSSVCGRVNAVGLTSILDKGQFLARRYADSSIASGALMVQTIRLFYLSLNLGNI